MKKEENMTTKDMMDTLYELNPELPDGSFSYFDEPRQLFVRIPTIRMETLIYPEGWKFTKNQIKNEHTDPISVF